MSMNKIRVALLWAAMVAAMPELLQFEDEKEKHFFTIKAGLLTVVSNLTAYSEKSTLQLRR